MGIQEAKVLNQMAVVTFSQRYGSSAMVLDNRVFVSFNPFNIFVTQVRTTGGIGSAFQPQQYPFAQS